MKLFEMEGFLRGKCIPRDLKVNETNAEYLVRKFAEADAMCAALAAENACLMQLIDWPKQQCPTTGDVTDVEPADFIPSTSAFLAEVRAQGVEMLAEHLSGMNISASETSVRDFAAQLRKGAQS